MIELSESALTNLIVLHNGSRAKVQEKLQEELRELDAAIDDLVKAENPGRHERFGIVSEMADVVIMLQELEVVMDCEAELDAVIRYKVARTLYEGQDGRKKP